MRSGLGRACERRSRGWLGRFGGASAVLGFRAVSLRSTSTSPQATCCRRSAAAEELLNAWTGNAFPGVPQNAQNTCTTHGQAMRDSPGRSNAWTGNAFHHGQACVGLGRRTSAVHAVGSADLGGPLRSWGSVLSRFAPPALHPRLHAAAAPRLPKSCLTHGQAMRFLGFRKTHGQAMRQAATSAKTEPRKNWWVSAAEDERGGQSAPPCIPATGRRQELLTTD